MAALTSVTNHVVVLGPIKVEFVRGTAAADADTYTSVMQRPLWAMCVPNTDGNADGIGINAAVSGRTVTLNHSSISSTVVSLIIVGF